MSHLPFPHVGHAPQSCGQLVQLSDGSHLPFGHVAHVPQSCGQLEQLSPESHLPFGHVAHVPQSAGQLEHVSPPSQTPSLHSGKQSEQVVDSPASHIPLPLQQSAGIGTTALAAAAALETADEATPAARAADAIIFAASSGVFPDNNKFEKVAVKFALADFDAELPRAEANAVVVDATALIVVAPPHPGHVPQS